MSTIKLVIMGKPIAKKRPRFVRKGNFVATYSAQKKEERGVKDIIKKQLEMIEHKKLGCAVSINTIYYMPIPKGTSGKKTKDMNAGLVYHIKKPDLDNLNKFYLDCLTGLAWKDDSQVVSMSSFKRYSNNPKTEIYIDGG